MHACWLTSGMSALCHVMTPGWAISKGPLKKGTVAKVGTEAGMSTTMLNFTGHCQSSGFPSEPSCSTSVAVRPGGAHGLGGQGLGALMAWGAL